MDSPEAPPTCDLCASPAVVRDGDTGPWFCSGHASSVLLPSVQARLDALFGVTT